MVTQDRSSTEVVVWKGIRFLQKQMDPFLKMRELLAWEMGGTEGGDGDSRQIFHGGGGVERNTLPSETDGSILEDERIVGLGDGGKRKEEAKTAFSILALK
ncbi:hypothetical protein QE152_g22909 [Popillia japonica]|uniref:Uncharacterized protein n=1 Tax=Popillia japonica TaxID=7064 RepID=A0AAW1KJG7_POPJA